MYQYLYSTVPRDVRFNTLVSVDIILRKYVREIRFKDLFFFFCRNVVYVFPKETCLKHFYNRVEFNNFKENKKIITSTELLHVYEIFKI
jgi:hypothetical protein